jgi:hypothetical protein
LLLQLQLQLLLPLLLLRPLLLQVAWSQNGLCCRDSDVRRKTPDMHQHTHEFLGRL